MGGGRRVQGPGRVHCLGRSRGRSREGTKGMSLVWYRSKRERNKGSLWEGQDHVRGPGGPGMVQDPGRGHEPGRGQFDRGLSTTRGRD